MKYIYTISVYPNGFSKYVKPLEVMTTDLSERVGMIVSYFSKEYSGFKKLHISVTVSFDDPLPF